MSAGQDTKYGEVTTENREFHEGEPVFIIRAQDPLAVEGIDAYGEICAKAECSSDHLAAITLAVGAFEEWQEANPEKVKNLPGE